jgi:hypothetical protein
LSKIEGQLIIARPRLAKPPRTFSSLIVKKYGVGRWGITSRAALLCCVYVPSKVSQLDTIQARDGKRYPSKKVGRWSLPRPETAAPAASMDAYPMPAQMTETANPEAHSPCLAPPVALDTPEPPETPLSVIHEAWSAMREQPTSVLGSSPVPPGDTRK